MELFTEPNHVPEQSLRSMTGVAMDWWHHPPLLHRFVESVLRGEMASLRPGGWHWPIREWEPMLHLGRDLGADSLELMSLASALGTAVDLPDDEGAETLHSSPTLGAWAAVAARALAARGDRMRYRSSGSSGMPHWYTHRLSDLMQELEAMIDVLGPHDRIVSAVPTHHVYGHLFGILLPMALARPDLPFLNMQGQAPLALSQRLRPGDLVLGYPHWWRMALDHGVHWPTRVTGMTSTAPCPPDLARALVDFGLSRMVQVYGSSETAGVGWRDQPYAPFQVHPFWRCACARREYGEESDWIVRRHAHGDESAVRAPDELAWSDPFHFRPMGRIDGIVQVGGVNVQPRAVRERLCRHPEVLDAAVRLHDFDGHPRLKAFVVARPGVVNPQLAEDVRAWTAQHLPTPARPVHITVGASLPVNAMGKSCDWPIAAG